MRAASHAKRRWILQGASFYTGFAKSGFGGAVGIVVTPLLTFVMPAKQSLGLVLPLLFLTDIVNIVLFWGQWDIGAALRLLPGAVVGILLTTRALVRLPEYWVRKSLGVLALSYVPVQIARMTVWQSFEPASLSGGWTLALGLIVGLAIGVFSTMGHVGGVVSTIYFLLLLPKENINAAMVGTATILYFWLNAVKLVTYARAGLITGETMRTVPRMLPGLAVGLTAGKLLNMSLGGARVDWFIALVLAVVVAMGWRLVRTPKRADA